MDVSLEETAICIVNEVGAIVKEMRADSEPKALADTLCAAGLPLERTGLERFADHVDAHLAGRCPVAA
jgi:hypothetical protein